MSSGFLEDGRFLRCAFEISGCKKDISDERHRPERSPVAVTAAPSSAHSSRTSAASDRFRSELSSAPHSEGTGLPSVASANYRLGEGARNRAASC